MSNHFTYINKDTGIILKDNIKKYIRLLPYDLTKTSDIIYIFDNVEQIGHIGLYYFNKTNDVDYFIYSSKEEIESNKIASYLSKIEFYLVTKQFVTNKPIKIINLQDIFYRISLNTTLNLTASLSSINMSINIGPLINIGQKIYMKDIVNDIKHIIEELYNVGKAYKVYSENYINQYNIVDKTNSYKLLNISDIETLINIENVALHDNDNEKINELLETFSNINKIYRGEKNTRDKHICGFKFYIPTNRQLRFDNYLYPFVKYKNIINESVICEYSTKVIYKILKYNNSYEKFISELKTQILVEL